MDGGASSSTASSALPLYHHQKRRFSTMADDYRSSSPDSLFVSQDDHFDNEQPPQRRRLNTSTLALPPRPLRFAGDGYDYRRPVTLGEAGRGLGDAIDGSSTAVIDLTADDDMRDTGSHSRSANDTMSAAAGSSRAQRLPRFHGRNIIDVEGEDEEEGLGGESHAETRPSTNNSSRDDLFFPHNHHDPSSNNHHPRFSILQRPQRIQPHPSNPDIDDIEFLEERPRRQTRSISRTHTPAAPMQRSITPYPTALNNPIDLTGDDDDVVHLESRVRPRTNLDRPTATAGVGTRSVLADRLPMIELGGRLFNRLMGAAPPPSDAAPLQAQQNAFMEHTHNHHRHVGTHHNPGQNVPELRLRFGGTGGGHIRLNMLDYGMVAFDLGIEGGNRPPTPKYEPPEATNTGFTRSPEEDEVVVCPNCGDELAMGETEEKQQIWVIKKCGHAYCGVCANNRSKSSRISKKGKGKAPAFQADGPPTFKSCVVDGCKESASSKSMVHVFLGS